MREHLFKPLLAFALVLVCGNACGETYTLTPNNVSTGNNASAYVTSAYSFTFNGISWNFNHWNPKTLQVKTNQSSAASEFNFKNTSAFPGKITSVVINFSTITVSNEKGFCFVGGSSAISNLSEGTSGTWDSTKQTLTWTPAPTDNFTYFAFYQNGKVASGSNFLVDANAIVVTYEASVGPVDPTITTTNMSCGVSESFDVSQMFSSNSEGTISYSVEGANAEDYDLDGSEFLSEVARTYTIKASQAADDDKYNAGEATAILTVLGKFTVNYYSLGVKIGTEEVYDGQSVANAPEVTSVPTGWSFIDWTTNDAYKQSATAPTFFDGVVLSNVSLYAVFGKTEVIGESVYKRVIADQSDWRGDYLIAYKKTVFMNGSLIGGKEGVGKTQTYVSPGMACSSDEMTVTATWGDKYYVTIEAIDDADLSKGYVIKSHNQSTPYFYHTSNSDGMSGTDNKKTAAKYPISVIFNSDSDIDIALGGDATGAVLHYNAIVGTSGEMFRFYKDGGQENVYLYKKNNGTCTTYALVPEYTVAISSVGFATAYMGFDAKVSGANAYYVTVSDGVASLSKVEGVIPANTGVVLEAQNVGKTTAKFRESVATADDKAAAEGNMLKGTLYPDGETFNEQGHTYYALRNGDYGICFYWDPDTQDKGASAKCACGKAILDVPSTGSASSSSIGIRFDGASLIVNTDLNEEKCYHDFLGHKVEKPSIGLYIVNGKKILVK